MQDCQNAKVTEGRQWYVVCSWRNKQSFVALSSNLCGILASVRRIEEIPRNKAKVSEDFQKVSVYNFIHMVLIVCVFQTGITNINRSSYQPLEIPEKTFCLRAKKS